MKKSYYFLIGYLLLSLSILSTGDWVVILVLGIFVIPISVLFQYLTYFICLKINKFKEYAVGISFLPVVVISLWILSYLSLWVQPGSLFKLVLETEMPSSVENFRYYEDTWTDYVLEMYFEIEKEDLNKILANPIFIQKEYSSNEIDFKNYGRQPFRSLPLLDVGREYYYETHDDKGKLAVRCDVYVNKKFDRVYVSYSVD